MKIKALTAFRSKLAKPCRKLLLIFKFKVKKPIFIRALGRHHPRRIKPSKTPSKNHIFTRLLSIFHPFKQREEMDRLMELRSVSEAGREKRHFPSPLTPAYIKAGRKSFGVEEVDDACRSFENYLVEMIVEEGKVKDLKDVEELLYCWKNLKSPVFIDLVCRFYGELCNDLFSTEDNDNSISSPK